MMDYQSVLKELNEKDKTMSRYERADWDAFLRDSGFRIGFLLFPVRRCFILYDDRRIICSRLSVDGDGRKDHGIGSNEYNENRQTDHQLLQK